MPAVAGNSPKSFGSDNHAGVHPAVLAAIAAAGQGDALPYGADDITNVAEARICAATGAHSAYFVFTGTAANVFGLSLLLSRPYEAVICAATSHLHVDECAAAERVLGCKLLPVATPDGKLTPALAATQLTGIGDEHRVQPRVLQVAQVTELGTCYSLDELSALQKFARDNGLLIYLDGARLANAAAYLGCGLDEIARYADVLSFGGTKNGALGVEAVLVMADGLGDGGKYHRKQQMQLASKMRFLSAQVDALLQEDLWLANARRANEMAAELAHRVETVPGVTIPVPTQSNGVFAEISREHASRLQRDWSFAVWAEQPGKRCLVRWMTAFDTTLEDVEQLAEAVAAAAVSRETV